MSSEICKCGKQQENLNRIDWTCHFNSCKKRKPDIQNSMTKLIKTTPRITGQFYLINAVFNILTYICNS